MANKHEVTFVATKKVKEPVVVSFQKKNGEPVVFPAHKKVNEQVVVDFFAKNKKSY